MTSTLPILVMAASVFTVVAHRGQSSQRPENTFAAFDLALELSFSHIETDVQLSLDGIPLVRETPPPPPPSQPATRHIYELRCCGVSCR